MKLHIIKSCAVLISVTLTLAITGCEQKPRDVTTPDHNQPPSQIENPQEDKITDKNDDKQKVDDKQSRDTSAWQNGTVKYIDLEGGFYGIIDSQGQKYNAANLPDAFKEDGLAVRFKTEELKGMISYRMWGKLVKITDIEKR